MQKTSPVSIDEQDGLIYVHFSNPIVYFYLRESRALQFIAFKTFLPSFQLTIFLTLLVTSCMDSIKTVMMFFQSFYLFISKRL